MRRVGTICFAMTVAAGSLGSQAQGQAPLAHVRDLYSNAAYEDVLSAVAADATGSPQIGQYKVFSLIALGRPAEAEQAAEAVLAGHLGFHPDSDASPRLVEVFTNARRKIAPDQLKSMYARARGLLDKKDREAAIDAFTEIVSLTGDPDLKDDRTAADVGFLAKGFLDLSRALPTATPPPAPVASSAKAESPAGAMNPPPASPSQPPPPSTVTLPQPIHEELPRWVPPATLARREYRGKILVHVAADGTVESAEIMDSVHPLYDGLLLSASKNWSYKPAIRNGAPVRADYTLEVVLKPQL